MQEILFHGQASILQDGKGLKQPTDSSPGEKAQCKKELDDTTAWKICKCSNPVCDFKSSGKQQKEPGRESWYFFKNCTENGKQNHIAADPDQCFKSVYDTGINDLHIHVES